MILSTRIAVAGALVALAVAVLLMAFHPFAASGGKLVWAGTSDAEGWSGPDEPAVGVAVSYGGLDPCVSKGSVTVTGFRFATGSGLVVDGWGSRPNPFDHGGGQQLGGGKAVTVVAAGFTTGPRRVSNLCSARTSAGDAARNDFEFAIQFHRTSATTGWASGVDVTYTSAGSPHTASWPLGYVMCGTTGAVPGDVGALAHLCPSGAVAQPKHNQ